MTILERLRSEGRTVDLGQIARDLRGELRTDLPAIGQEAIDAVERVLDAASKAIESTGAAAEAAPTGGLAAAAGEAVAHLGDAASRTGDSIGQSIARAGRELNLDGRVEDLVGRVRRELPTDRITALVAHLERELPTTDKDRYDRAYSRGWTRARSSFVGIGVVAGIAAGVAGAFLFDPARGPERRAAIGARTRRIGSVVTQRVRATATVATDRARDLAARRGQPGPDSVADASAAAATTLDVEQEAPAVPALVGVMDDATTSVAGLESPIADDVTTEPAAAPTSV